MGRTRAVVAAIVFRETVLKKLLTPVFGRQSQQQQLLFQQLLLFENGFDPLVSTEASCNGKGGWITHVA